MRIKKLIIPLVIPFLLASFHVEAREGVYICSVPSLAVYLRPAVSPEKITEIKFGQPLIIIGIHERWQKVFLHGGVVGWIKKGNIFSASEFKRKHLYLISDSKAQEQLFNQYSVYFKGTMNRWGLDVLKIKLGYVNKDKINIREGPGEVQKIVARAVFGRVYEILREQHGWHEVVIGANKNGWIRFDLLSSKAEIDRLLRNKIRGRTSIIAYVATLKQGKTGVTIRSGPSVEYKKVGIVHAGDNLFITDLFGDWVRIFLKRGGTGWVFRPLLIKNGELTEKYSGMLLYKEDFLEMGVYKDVFSQRRHKRSDAQKQLLIEKELSGKEASLQNKLAEERRQHEQTLAAEKQRLRKAQLAFDKKQKSLENELEKKKTDWKESQEVWFAKQKSDIDFLQKQEEGEIAEGKASLSMRKKEIESLSKEMEEKNRKARLEITRMRESLQEDIAKFEKAKEEALALVEEEESLDDEAFFFDDEATEELDNKMDEIDSIKEVIEAEIAQEKEQLARQKNEMEAYQKEMETRLAEERERIRVQNDSLQMREKRNAEEADKALQKIEKERERREKEFKGQLKIKEAEFQKNIIEIEKQVETERRASLKMQKMVEDSIARLGKNTKLLLEEEKKEIDTMLKKERARMTSELSVKNSTMAEERRKLDEEWARLKEERRKLRKEKESIQEKSVPLSRGTENKVVDQYQKDFGDFLESMEGQTQSSSRSFNEITNVLSGTVSNIMKVYTKLQKKDPSLSGRITVNFIILTTGEITNLNISSRTIKSRKLRQSVTNEFQSCKFKKVSPDNKPVLMTYPLLFFPRE